MLKLIPEERPDSQPKGKKSVKARKTENAAHQLKFQQKAQHAMRVENSILKAVTIKLDRYMKNSSRATEQEMSELIHSLQRTVLTIQRVRHKKHKMDHKRKK